MPGAFAERVWPLAHGRVLTLGPRGLLMGIVNVTPDSFSDGGLAGDARSAQAHAVSLARAGADILDLGAESTRPGADPVDAATEQARLLPALASVMEALSGMVISVDTYRASTAERAVGAGAHIINDVWGFQRDPDIARVAAQTGAGVVLMHTGRDRTIDADVIEDQKRFLGRSIEIALAAGVSEAAIVLDPGFGFAKDPAQNMQLMARFGELHALGFPLLAGTSRKRFIGHVTGRDTDQRDVGTAATTALLRMAGAAVFRVHDVAMNKDALAIADAMVAATLATVE